MKVVVRKRVDPLPSASVLVGAVPGAGYVGKIAVDHLIHELKAKLVAEIFTSAFPPQVFIRNDGLAYMPSFQLYYAKVDNIGGVLVFTGSSQTETGEAGYEVIDKLLEIARGSGVRMVYSLAAYIVTQEPTGGRVVHGTATSKSLLEKLKNAGVKLMDGGTITGMNGLLFAMAPLRGMEGVCLLGETTGYYADAKASKDVLRAFAQLSGISVDYSPLDVMASQTEKALAAMREAYAKEIAKQEKERKAEYIS